MIATRIYSLALTSACLLGAGTQLQAAETGKTAQLPTTESKTAFCGIGIGFGSYGCSPCAPVCSPRPACSPYGYGGSYGGAYGGYGGSYGGYGGYSSYSNYGGYYGAGMQGGLYSPMMPSYYGATNVGPVINTAPVINTWPAGYSQPYPGRYFP